MYEHADPRKGHQPDWDSNIFNYGRNEVRNFLISSALFWLDRYHIDSLRLDAMASMPGSSGSTAPMWTSVVSFLRRGKSTGDLILVVANFTPVTYANYRVGAPRNGYWQELLNGDARIYGGSGQGNLGGQETSPIPYHGHPNSLNLTIPPLAVMFFKNTGQAK